MIRVLESDGWYQVGTKGSHRQFKHDARNWIGYRTRETQRCLGAWDTEQHPEAGGVKVMKYLIVIEKSATGYPADSPDLPGCVSTGATLEETEASMKEAMEFHIEGLKQEGLPIPKPSSLSSYVEVAA